MYRCGIGIFHPRVHNLKSGTQQASSLTSNNEPSGWNIPIPHRYIWMIVTLLKRISWFSLVNCPFVCGRTSLVRRCTFFPVSTGCCAWRGLRETTRKTVCSMAVKRFASHTETEIDDKKAKVTPKNTLKANNAVAKVFREYLLEKGQSVDFEEYSTERLATVL